MHALDLERAAAIIKRAGELADQMLHPCRKGQNPVISTGSNTFVLPVYLNQEVAEKALEMQRDCIRVAHAKLVRDAAQIGVVLEPLK